MEEILDFLSMEETELINSLERINSKIPNRVLKLNGYILKEYDKKKLEIIIFKASEVQIRIQLK